MNTELTDFFQPLFQGLNQPDLSLIRDFTRVRPECQNQRDQVIFPSFFIEKIEYFPVSEVDTIEIADSDSCLEIRLRKIFKTAYDIHGLKTD